MRRWIELELLLDQDRECTPQQLDMLYIIMLCADPATREFAVLRLMSCSRRVQLLPLICKLANTDPCKAVRVASVQMLGRLPSLDFKEQQGINDTV